MRPLKRISGLGGFAAASLVLALSGCATQTPVTDPMGDLKAGKLNLTCGVLCSLQWNFQVGSINALDVAERWPDLATAVMKISYGNDLADYYLGQSAQGLGYHEAAIAYYTYALALSNGSDPLLKCEGIPGQTDDKCQDVDLVNSIPVLIHASRDAIAARDAQQAPPPPPPPPPRKHHKRKPPASTGSGFEAPPPPAATAPAPSAPSAPASGGGSGFDAPPPPPPSNP